MKTKELILEKKLTQLLLKIKQSLRKKLAESKDIKRSEKIKNALAMSDGELLKYVPVMVSDVNLLEQYWSLLNECYGAESAKIVSEINPQQFIKRPS